MYFSYKMLIRVKCIPLESAKKELSTSVFRFLIFFCNFNNFEKFDFIDCRFDEYVNSNSETDDDDLAIATINKVKLHHQSVFHTRMDFSWIT